MTELTRRPDNREGRFVYFGDICVGHIGLRSGAPVDEARAGFEEAWNRLRPIRTEAHFELWRAQRDFTAWKYRMHDAGLKLPTQTQNNRSRCFCGAEIANRSIDAHIQKAHGGMTFLNLKPR